MLIYISKQDWRIRLYSSNNQMRGRWSCLCSLKPYLSPIIKTLLKSHDQIENCLFLCVSFKFKLYGYKICWFCLLFNISCMRGPSFLLIVIYIFVFQNNNWCLSLDFFCRKINHSCVNWYIGNWKTTNRCVDFFIGIYWVTFWYVNLCKIYF